MSTCSAFVTIGQLVSLCSQYVCVCSIYNNLPINKRQWQEGRQGVASWSMQTHFALSRVNDGATEDDIGRIWEAGECAPRRNNKKDKKHPSLFDVIKSSRRPFGEILVKRLFAVAVFASLLVFSFFFFFSCSWQCLLNGLWCRASKISHLP